ncbi:MAG: 16S rRNA (guanine(966)-N(2))-methyltransferase RsmD [Nitrospirae bacterium RBG_13_39_12]|nr:MAG: 16S rRNA (guanine(966)-N(2))-methyltransferase RsmD [Nitrospirae bacterium RBG_13_39_12]
MKISGGLEKGRQTATKRLFSKLLKGRELRPTTSKVREALFDIIMKKIEGAVFVDLYAGTGTVGLEALSRGASKAIFVEPDDLLVKTIKKNIDEFGFQKRAFVFKGKAYEFLVRSSEEKDSFDIFFLDPPYHSKEIDKILPIIGEKRLLKEGGIVIVENYFKKEMPEKASNLMKKKSYRYGDTMLTIYRNL